MEVGRGTRGTPQFIEYQPWNENIIEEKDKVRTVYRRYYPFKAALAKRREFRHKLPFEEIAVDISTPREITLGWGKLS